MNATGISNTGLGGIHSIIHDLVATVIQDSSRRFLWFLCCALVVGAGLRLNYPQDIEYKADERWTFEHTQRAGPVGDWPAVGMPSSRGVENPGASVWVFIVLAKAGRVTSPVGLSRAVEILNIGALLLLCWFSLSRIPREERQVWLWATAMICVNPLYVLWSRKIWAQSVLPFFMMLFLLGWWHRASDNRAGKAGAFTWGLLGAIIGQIHLSGFFLAGAVLLWTLMFDPDRRRIAWKSWWFGSLVGAAGLIPWVVHIVGNQTDARGSWAFLRVFELKWWNYWVSNPTGVTLKYSLGDHFRDFLTYPLVGQHPAYGVALLHVVLLGVSALALWKLIGHLYRSRGDWRRLFTGSENPQSLVTNAYFWGCGILLTLVTTSIFRHYLLVAFPLTTVWFCRILYRHGGKTGSRSLAVMWGAQLLLTLALQHYIHVNGGAPDGDYGTAFFAQ